MAINITDESTAQLVHTVSVMQNAKVILVNEDTHAELSWCEELNGVPVRVVPGLERWEIY